jgi:hypothetical protein
MSEVDDDDDDDESAELRSVHKLIMGTRNTCSISTCVAAILFCIKFGSPIDYLADILYAEVYIYFLDPSVSSDFQFWLYHHYEPSGIRNIPYFLEYPVHIFQKKFIPKSGVHGFNRIKVNSSTYLSYLVLRCIPEGSSPRLC